jgi:hypothetical protein
MSFVDRHGGLSPMFMWVVAFLFVSPMISWWITLILGVVVLVWPRKPEGVSSDA